MTNSNLLALTALALIGCVGDLDEPDDPTLSEDEQALTGAGNLDFEVGYGEGYLSPIPDTHYGVVDGMLGWIETDTISFGGATIRLPAFKTKSASDATRVGHTFLTFQGTVPATGSCALSAGALIVDGSTHVEGKNPFPYTGGEDSRTEAVLWLRTYVNGTLKYSKYWNVGYDATKSEIRNKYFDKSYYLSSAPSFFATAGQPVEVELELVTSAWANSEGSSSVSIYQYGFLANLPNNIVSVQCY